MFESTKFLVLVRFGYLDDHIDSRQTLTALRGVCRATHRSLDPLFWKCLTVDASYFDKYWDHCLVISNERAEWIQHLSITTLYHFKSSANLTRLIALRLGTLMQAASNLKSLYVADFGFRSMASVDPPKLIQVRSKQGVRVETLCNIHGKAYGKVWDALPLLPWKEPPKHINLHLRHNNENKFDFPPSKQIPPVKSLSVRYIIFEGFHDNDGYFQRYATIMTLQRVLETLRVPNLKRLSKLQVYCGLTVCITPTSTALPEHQFPNITNLEWIFGLDIMPFRDLNILLSHFPSITHLGMRTERYLALHAQYHRTKKNSLTKEHIGVIERMYPNLNSINVSFLENVSSLSGLSKLKHLTITIEMWEPLEPLKASQWPDMPFEWRQSLETITIHVEPTIYFDWGVDFGPMGKRCPKEFLQSFCEEAFVGYTNLKWFRIKDRMWNLVTVVFMKDGRVVGVENRQLRVGVDFNQYTMDVGGHERFAYVGVKRYLELYKFGRSCFREDGMFKCHLFEDLEEMKQQSKKYK